MNTILVVALIGLGIMWAYLGIKFYGDDIHIYSFTLGLLSIIVAHLVYKVKL